VIKNTKQQTSTFSVGKNKIDNDQPVWHGGMLQGNLVMLKS